MNTTIGLEGAGNYPSLIRNKSTLKTGRFTLAVRCNAPNVGIMMLGFVLIMGLTIADGIICK